MRAVHFRAYYSKPGTLTARSASTDVGGIDSLNQLQTTAYVLLGLLHFITVCLENGEP